MSTAVLYQVVDGVATVTLNRPERFNAMVDELLDSLVERLDAAANDDAVRVVVLTGAGRAFCAGGDMHDLSGSDLGAAEKDTLVAKLRHHTRSTELLHRMPKVTIAAVNGACAGAGLSLACAADVRVASERAVFRTAFASAAMAGDFGGTWSLPRIIGGAHARSLFFLNQKIDARRALEMGLVSEVIAESELSERVTEIAEQIAQGPPLALASIKTSLNEALSVPLEEALVLEGERHIATAQSQDAAEAALAFVAKRRPIFVGK
ncbi:enoyl-CoA hydratase-related protein [Nocardioides sp.]|uniref:enoyl-CoA hydratase/isomerase family protein n=1 Tax=Nocardioides sp. TaxID=35761 RepID=UPI002614DC71|nr:enoyl-CoA hydratase-related protein [Nocardioides sp.]MDI6912325.1 enoyl-CoA hydratase-related protein [Nocardioides sp.]